jgi:6-phospho-3-hexuloisomerase
LDYQEIKVYFIPIAVFLWHSCDFAEVMFPESPTYWAYSITFRATLQTTFDRRQKEQMDNPNQQQTAAGLKAGLEMILMENVNLAKRIDFDQVALLIPYIHAADRIFLIAAGRSGLALRAAAMRLMHFGLTVFVAGETTTPAIRKGDLLIAASGSGTTSTIVKAAEKAVAAGAAVAVFSTTADSPLAKLSSLLMILPAAQKEDHGTAVSAQYAGSLFEQALLLLTDAIFQTLWAEDGTPAQELWKRHANLE